METQIETRQIDTTGIAHERLMESDLEYFATHAGLRLDGLPFSFDRHEYLREIYEVMLDPGVRELNVEKAAQGGFTVGEVLFSFHAMRYGRCPKGILYLLPTEKHAEKVSKTKVQPIIDENPLLQSWISSTDSTMIKRIGPANFVMGGLETKKSEKNVNILSYSVDALALDEFDVVSDWSQVALAEERMSHSGVEWLGRTIEGGTIHRLSVPSIPGYGIDAYFAGNPELGIPPSEQRFLHFRCEHCNEWTCFEDEFPDCLVEVNAKERTAIRICKKCQRELLLTARQEWVPKDLNSVIKGYHYSQLFSSYVNPWKILDQFRRRFELTTLFNDKLGLPYIEAEARLEIKDIIALETSSPQLTAHPGPCAMGVDQPKSEGGKFHVTIGYRTSTQPCNIIRICIRNTWNELADLMGQFNVGRCVVDGLPDQAKARDFAKMFAGKVYLNYYAHHQKGAAKWKDDDWTVSVDRTESLNASTRAVHEQKVSIPRADDMDVKMFARHCHNIARKKEEDKDTGSVTQIWVRTGADHYRHAYNYLFMALPEIGEYTPPKDRDWKPRRHRHRKRSWKTI